MSGHSAGVRGTRYVILFCMTLFRGVLWSVIIIGLTAGVLALLGRVWVSTTGQLLWWVSDIGSPEASQQISDWYSASHFIHGLIFFGFFWIFKRYLSLGTRLLLSTIIEAGWEILENSSFIIDKYREGTIAIGYMGDSILNSVCDIGFMVAGFFFARFVPWWVSLLFILVLEIGVAYMIRDNLFLNVLMLVYPVDAVRAWQGG